MKETKNKVKSFFKGEDTKQQNHQKFANFVGFSSFRTYSF